MFLFCVALALFLPIPLSAYGPAIALFVTGFGLVERDGLVTLVGVALGMAAIVVTHRVGDADLHGRGRRDRLTPPASRKGPP